MKSEFYVNLIDIHHAAARICGHIRTTPLLESPLLNAVLNFRLLLKAENLQHTCSFKLRGAFNQILQLPMEAMTTGVVAYSSGNHAQAVACAAASLSIPATILMPHDAPAIKMEKTRAFGAEIVTYNRNTEDRYVVGERLLIQRGGRLIHSYDDARTVAGQGTVGLEIFEQTKKLDIEPNALIVNCCGGGLAAGIVTTLDLYTRKPKIFTAEPKDFDDARRSLTAGKLLKNDRVSGSICDALLMPSVGLNNFHILQHHAAEGLTASDEDVRGAMAVAYEHFGQILEPSGAMGLACAILNRDMFRGQTVVVVASGGNVDPEGYIGMLQSGAVRASAMLPKLGSNTAIGGPR